MTVELTFSMVLAAWNILATVLCESHWQASALEHTSQQLLKTENMALKETIWVVLENALGEVLVDQISLLTLKWHMILSMQISRDICKTRRRQSTSKIRSMHNIWTSSLCQFRSNKNKRKLMKKWKKRDVKCRPNSSTRLKCFTSRNWRTRTEVFLTIKLINILCKKTKKLWRSRSSSWSINNEMRCRSSKTRCKERLMPCNRHSTARS